MDKDSLIEARYRAWREYPHHSPEMARELEALQNLPEEREDRFYRDLAFGTGGLRGILGAGTNRMNIYTVRRTTLGLAKFMQERGTAQRGVAVGYDCRHFSRTFAEEVARVMAAAGIRTYVFEHLCPTPELSFTVRQYGCGAGIMITASHNPPEYNGYKVYDANGCQVLDADADRILHHIESVQDGFSVPVLSVSDAESQGLVQWVGEQMDRLYTDTVVNQLLDVSLSDARRQALKVVYSPLHGTGNHPVRDVLQQAGYTQVHVVEAQAQPDGNFSTVKSPNPEEASAFEYALQLANEVDADIALATDPDADRVGVAVRLQDGTYRLLTGNQVGGLLVDYVLHRLQNQAQLPENGVVFKTVVTSELGAALANTYGVSVENTLTGFKYIGDQIRTHQERNTGTFLFGYEESYGYLAGDFVRDKDAVQICLLICELAAHCKSNNETLWSRLETLYRRVGYYAEALLSKTLPGADGMEQMAGLMKKIRTNGLPNVGRTLSLREDYASSTRTTFAEGQPSLEERILLPASDVLKFVYADGAWLAIRPSGTEPKIKVYIGARGESARVCETVLEDMKKIASTVLAL